ncbi:MAG TPA: DNA adenine methylase [Polyangia bacterium]|nr:DNA adenine methylase [Polyangia bacterium]
MSDSAPLRPFLKWAGGKRQLLPRILELAPTRIRTYCEPFIGGGAVFFALAGERRFERAVLGDVNPELIGCYEAVRDRAPEVIRLLGGWRNREDDYYRVREQRPAQLSPTERAARLIYLNRCGYNGLYRVNSEGIFNVPFGRYASVRICDPERLEAASRALRSVELICGDFRTVIEACAPARQDFVYLDPPYVPISSTASFTAYAGAFDMEDQRRLAQQLCELAEARVPAVLSNSYCRATLSLYRHDGLLRQRVQARRAINSVATRRGPIAEILVRTAAV